MTEWSNGSVHCFVCGHHPKKSSETIESLKSSLIKRKDSFENVELPKDFDYYIPPIGYEWVGKYLNRTEILRHKFGWSEARQSVIIPTFNETKELVMYQARYFGPDIHVPKYRTYGHRHDIIDIPDPWSRSDTLVLVEDRISAIKVCRVANAMPLYGNSLSLPTAMNLKKHFKRVKIWLDSNMKMQSIKTSLTIGELGLISTVIFSDKDPKEYDTHDIREMVNL